MNLIDAWKKAGRGQKVTRPCKDFITKTDSIRVDIINESVGNLLADDWEIAKEKKKVVIEGEFMQVCRDCAYAKAYFKAHNTKLPLVGILVKHTLEWEE